MKNILVPTDFSDCAAYATELGINFAKSFNATLFLYACIDIPEDWNEFSQSKKDQYTSEQQLIKNTQILMTDWQEKAKEKGVQVEMLISGGKLISGIEARVDENDIDFVVMGSHGAGGKNEYFMGSNTQKAVRKLHVPVFVVKNKLTEFSFKQVVYASSFDANEKESFLQFLEFINKFSPDTIHLVGVKTLGWFSQPSFLTLEAMKDFKALCGDQPCETHFYRDLSVDAGIRHIAEEIAADLIVISNHHRHPLKRIFSGSNVEALVNHCEVPVLSIDYTEEPAKAKEKSSLFKARKP